MSFTIRRLNLEHKAKFPLRGHSTQQVVRFVRQPLGRFEVLGALIKRSLIISLVVLTPVAQAHAKAKVKKRTVVNITFDTAAPDANAVKAPVTQDSKIVRSLRPVDRYADDSADQVIAEDTTESIEPLRTIASVQVRPKGPISADAAISDSFLDETPLESNADIPMRTVETGAETEMLEETDLAFVEED